ncbi:lipid-binding SYLF domain-containing protein [Entomobacter blattae]|uniref:Las17-binding protein actin regulator n=1 Tax=Entomobacter blattae TaxID=2762277 RepID=A0A7H1NPB2_9PROT|nr:lipid-binding SYLF domain-containing protein [Entomobacter blattae]QNT77622.1 Las17-binding protein actin regulator [Entomobacter blattae]
MALKSFSSRISSLLALSLLLWGTTVLSPAWAASNDDDDDDITDQQSVVDKAALTVQDFFVASRGDDKNNVADLRKNLQNSKGIMICPSVFRLSLVFGGTDGNCVLLARDAKGSWSDPAFYTLSGGSFGLQLGVQDSQAIFFIMSRKGLRDLMDHQMHMGADASASLASMGGSSETGSDIIAQQKAKGLFAGVSLKGVKLGIDSGSNHSYYHQQVGPEDILITMRVNNPGADPLRAILNKYSAGGSTSSSADDDSTSSSGGEASSTPSSGPYPDNYDPEKSYSRQVKTTPLGTSKGKSSHSSTKQPVNLKP